MMRALYTAATGMQADGGAWMRTVSCSHACSCGNVLRLPLAPLFLPLVTDFVPAAEARWPTLACGLS